MRPKQLYPPRMHVAHAGDVAVKVGPYNVYAGGVMYPASNHLHGPDTVLVPLTDSFPRGWLKFGGEYRMVWSALQDFGGVTDDWKEFLGENIIPRLQEGQKLLAFCAGSHGRTGVFLASLIAMLETAEETPDPIAAVRERHCVKAVETAAQVRAVFALRDQSVPKKYQNIR